MYYTCQDLLFDDNFTVIDISLIFQGGVLLLVHFNFAGDTVIGHPKSKGSIKL